MVHAPRVLLRTLSLGVVKDSTIVDAREAFRKKDGKLHRYFSVVENRRVGVKKRTVQRTVLHLGEINSSQESAWRKTLEVFDETRQQPATLSLFADDEPVAGAREDRRTQGVGGVVQRQAQFGDSQHGAMGVSVGWSAWGRGTTGAHGGRAAPQRTKEPAGSWSRICGDVGKSMAAEAAHA